MTPESQRIAIAEACGWTVHHGDPLDDLNAMHESEMVLNETQRYRYIALLVGKDWPEAWLITDADKAIRSTATQRAEAFLRTLGLWKD